MRVRWIGDTRLVPGLGCPVAGQEYDVPEDVGASLCEQGKAVVVAVVEPVMSAPPKTTIVKPPPKPEAASTDEEEEE